MDLPIASPLELALVTDVGNHNIKVPVEEAEDGEELKEEVREITDEECLELLEGVDMTSGVEDQLKFQVNKNAEDIQHLSTDVSQVKTAVMGADGAPGYIQRTEEMFKDLKQDNKEGFQTIHALLKSMDDTLLYMQGENKKKIEANEKCIEGLTDRVEALEKRNEAEDQKKNENRHLFKSAAVSVIAKWIGGAGALALTALGSIKAYLMVMASKGGG